MVGFIKGGSEGSLPLCKASAETSTVLVLKIHVASVAGQQADGDGELLHTSPFSSWKTSLALVPSIVLLISSEATQPSAASGCHALVPTS